MQMCRPFNKEDDNMLQGLEPYVPVLLTWGPQWKLRWKIAKNIFKFQGKKIDVSYQAVFVMTYMGLHDKEVRDNTIGDPLSGAQRQTGCFLFFRMMVHPNQADSKLQVQIVGILR